MARPTEEAIQQKYEGDGYPIHVVGRHVKVTEPMKVYAVDKLKKAKRFGVRLNDVNIAMDLQKLAHTVDFVLNVNNMVIKVSGCAPDMYSAIDEAIARLERILRRYTQRLHMHAEKPLKEIEMEVSVLEASALEDLNDEIEEEALHLVEDSFKSHPIVKREKMAVRTLTQAEAVMHMELSGQAFMLYFSEEDQKLKVIYRHADGNFAIVEPE